MAADKSIGSFEFHERTGILTAGMFGITALLVLFYLFGTGTLNYGGKAIILALVVLFAVAARKFYQRGKSQPALTLTNSGVSMPGFAREIPWTDITTYEVIASDSGRDLSFHFYLHDSVPPPERRKSAVKSGYNPKRHRIQALVMFVKKYKGIHIDEEMASAEIERRLNAAYARMETD